MKTGNYFELVISAAEALQELLIAELAGIGYEGFEESGLTLKAYIPEGDFSDIKLNKLSNQYHFIYSKSIIYKQNWNKVWESNFEPVQVADFVGIRAGFHPSFKGVAHEIIITPKMSFGTGHHATTYAMMQMMQELDCKGRSVFDFGTGTGILAILAEKMGATNILAVDNDDWCIENALENISINECISIDIQKVDYLRVNDTFDIILANINKNIILDNLHFLSGALEQEGQLLLSGLLKEDETEIVATCYSLELQHQKTIERNGWIAALFCRFS
jgi:ribosomal protein L11 methyltransferase